MIFSAIQHYNFRVKLCSVFCTNCEFHFAFELVHQRGTRQLFAPTKFTYCSTQRRSFLPTRFACIIHRIFGDFFAAASCPRTSRLANSARRDGRTEATAQPERGQHHRRQANHHLRRPARQTARSARHPAQGRCLFWLGVEKWAHSGS